MRREWLRPGWAVEYGSTITAEGLEMSLTVRSQLREDTAVISVAGELDMATAPELQTHVNELTEQGCQRLIFDLGDTSFCDSTGLSVFVRAKNTCDAAGGDLRLAAPQRGVRRILEVSGLIDVLPTYDTVEDAISASAVTASE
ncbi:STAS domain-containing protein [Pilimelia columellifera subsp. columellifera]|uniref:Anti-sigma factor antagonist n=2 Tax=Pilimelia TaxID=53370 RepID=A0ABP6A505_9ACTN